MLAGLCAALEKDQFSSKSHPKVIKPVGKVEPRKTSIEPAYLDDYIISLKDDVNATKLRELVSQIKQRAAIKNAPDFQVLVAEDDIHEEFNMFALKKVSVVAYTRSMSLRFMKINKMYFFVQN